MRTCVVCFLSVAMIGKLAAASDPRHVVAKSTSTEVSTSGSSTAAGSAAETDGPLLLEVNVNGHSTGKIGEFSLRNGKLMTRAQELTDLGFRLPESRVAGPGRMIALTDVPGLRWTIDQKSQELFVTVGDRRLLPTILKANGREVAEGRRVIESGTGMTFNYDVLDTLINSKSNASAALDLRAFSSWGILSLDWLGYAGKASHPTSAGNVRLDSAYSFADVNTLRRYTAGDFVSSGLGWTRPVHVTGIQIRSDFSMRPDLITFPLPSIAGTTAVPSTVEILANGSVLATGETGGGPFEAPQLPVVSGAGTISMTLTNALGQQVTLNQPFYASANLLAPGLQSYAVQAGSVRRRWGTVSNDYGKFTASAIYRRGLTPRFTIEGSSEVTAGALVGGVGGIFQVGHLGTVNVSAAADTGSGRPGTQVSAGAQRIGRSFSVGASTSLATRDYRDVAALNGGGILRKQTSAFASLFLRRFGSAGVAYAAVNRDASPNPLLAGVDLPERSKVLSANYSFQIHRVALYASEFVTFADGGNSNGLEIGVRIPLGHRSSVDMSVTPTGNAQIHAQRSAVMIGEWGYDAFVAAGSSAHEFAQVQYKSPVGLFTTGVDSSDGQTTLRMESQGAVSLVDKAIFPSNTIYDSFAVVDTGPVPHVRVFQENRDVGKTNRFGRLLVPDLRSFDLNRLTIDSSDVPADVTLSDPARPVRPQDRSGVVIKFPIKISNGALLTLVDEAGTVIPFGSTAKLHATGVIVPIGYEGKAYVEDLGPHNEILVEESDNRHCVVTFSYRSTAGTIPTIGPLRCKLEHP